MIFSYTLQGREILENSEMTLWNSPSKGYTEENVRQFISAYNKKVAEADLEIGADCSVLRKILKVFKTENNLQCRRGNQQRSCQCLLK